MVAIPSNSMQPTSSKLQTVAMLSTDISSTMTAIPSDEMKQQQERRKRQRRFRERLFPLQQLLPWLAMLVYMIHKDVATLDNHHQSLSLVVDARFCLPEEIAVAHDDQTLFYKCYTRMSDADKNDDDRLDYNEFETYLQLMQWSLYVVRQSVNMTQSIQDGLWQDMVRITGDKIDENGNPQIDIFGADIDELPEVDEKIKDGLHEMCDATLQAFRDAEPEEEKPELMVLANVIAENDNDPNIKLVDKAEALELNPTMLSIHSSFIIANFQGLEASEVDIDSAAEDKNSSKLHLAYADFVDELLSIVCPKEGEAYSECMDHPQFKYETAYDPASGQLCGSHAEYVRRIFCGEEEDRRQRDLKGRELEPGHMVDNVVLYRVIDTLCPIPMLHQGEGGGQAPQCQTVYAHYLLHLQDLDVAHKRQITEVYVNITQAAIDNGMLEDSLREIDPGTNFTIEGAGEHARPPDKNQYKAHYGKRGLKEPCTRRTLRLDEDAAVEDKPESYSISGNEAELIAAEIAEILTDNLHAETRNDDPNKESNPAPLLKGLRAASKASSFAVLNGMLLGVTLFLCIFW